MYKIQFVCYRIFGAAEHVSHTMQHIITPNQIQCTEIKFIFYLQSENKLICIENPLQRGIIGF